jgi:hypothetical protein
MLTSPIHCRDHHSQGVVFGYPFLHFNPSPATVLLTSKIG